MAGFIQNLIWNSVEGFVEAGMRTGGEYAGNALIKAGDAIENGGRGVGTSIESKATNYGTKITGQTYKPNPQALPSTARKPAIKRSNSTPANSKPTTGGAKGGVPIGGKKYPGTNQVNGAVGAGKKAVGGGVNRAMSTAGGVTGTAKSTVGGVTGNASKTVGGVVGGGQKALGGATKSIPPFKGPTSTPASNKTLPKPYPNSNGLPKSNDAPAYPSAKKAPIKPGQPKPFTAPIEQKKSDAKKPYPGTNTLPGQAPRVPVQNQKYKPMPKMAPQIGQGQKMEHISV